MDLKAYIYGFVICGIAYVHLDPRSSGNNKEDRQIDYDKWKYVA